MNHQKVQKLCYFGEKLSVKVFQSLMMEENAISSKKKTKQTNKNKQAKTKNLLFWGIWSK